MSLPQVEDVSDFHCVTSRNYDELGYWEKRGYSNTDEPWLNDRYS